MLSALNEFALYPPLAVISPKGTKNSLFFKLSSCLKNGFEGFSVLGTETEVSRDLLAYYVVCRAAAAGGRGGSFFMTYIFVQIQVYQDQLGGSRGLRIEIRDELVEKRP